MSDIRTFAEDPEGFYALIGAAKRREQALSAEHDMSDLVAKTPEEAEMLSEAKDSQARRIRENVDLLIVARLIRAHPAMMAEIREYVGKQIDELGRLLDDLGRRS